MPKIVIRSYEEENQRRKKFRLVALFLMIPLLAIIMVYDAKLASMFFGMNNAIQYYEEGDFEQSKIASDSQKSFNLIQSWLPYFNAGTARTRLEEYDNAIIDLTTALGLVSTQENECPVRNNLSIAYERYGDLKLAERANDLAYGFYELALQVLNEAPDICFPPDSGDQSDPNQPPQEGSAEQDNMQDNRERMEGKADGSEAGEGTPSETEEGEGEPLSREEQIKAQTEQTNVDRENKEAQGSQGDGDGSDGSSGVSKPW